MGKEKGSSASRSRVEKGREGRHRRQVGSIFPFPHHRHHSAQKTLRLESKPPERIKSEKTEKPNNLKRKKKLTQSSGYKSPSSPLSRPKTPSTSPAPPSAPDQPWPCAPRPGFWRERLLARLRSVRRKCARGCRWSCRWRGRSAFRGTCGFGVRLGGEVC